MFAEEPAWPRQQSEAAAHVRAGREALRRGRLGEARALFAEAARSAKAEADRESLVAAALGIGGLWVFEQRGFLERVDLEQLWDQALAEVEAYSLTAARLQVRVAAEAVYAGRSIGAVEQAVTKVFRFGDDTACAEALSLLHHVRLGPSFAHSRVQLAEDIVRLAVRANDAVLGLMGLCWRTVDLYLLGDKRGDQSLQELRERAEGCEAIAFIAEVITAMQLARQGRLSEAETAAEEACHRGVAAGDPDALAYFGALLSTLRWWQGRGEEIIEQVRELARSPRLGSNVHVYVAANALLSGALGDVDAAEEALAWLVGAGLDDLPDSSSWLTTQFLAGEAAFLLGDTAVARQVSVLLLPYAELPVMPSLAVVCLGSTKRALGLAAATCGDQDAAVRWLEGALENDRRLGSRPMTILTENVLASVLDARRGDGDRVRSAALSAHATDRARHMGLSLPPPPAWLQPGMGVRHRCQLTQQRGGWRVDVDGRSAVVGDSLGMVYLAALVAAPDQDHHVLKLAMAGDWMSSAPQPVLDQRAMTSYRGRARELSDFLTTPEAVSTSEADLRREREAIRQVLRSATGRFGSSRDFPTEQERARTAVRKALVRALRSIHQSEPGFGEHLQQALMTGTICRYQADAAWTVKVMH